MIERVLLVQQSDGSLVIRGLSNVVKLTKYQADKFLEAIIDNDDFSHSNYKKYYDN